MTQRVLGFTGRSVSLASGLLLPRCTAASFKWPQGLWRTEEESKAAELRPRVTNAKVIMPVSGHIFQGEQTGRAFLPKCTQTPTFFAYCSTPTTKQWLSAPLEVSQAHAQGRAWLVGLAHTVGSSNCRNSHCVCRLQELTLGCANSETHMAQNRAQLPLLPPCALGTTERWIAPAFPSRSRQHGNVKYCGHALCFWWVVANWLPDYFKPVLKTWEQARNKIKVQLVLYFPLHVSLWILFK